MPEKLAWQRGVLRLTLLDLCALPLANAGAASIGEHGAANLAEHLDQAVALNGGPDLLASGRDGEGHLHINQRIVCARLGLSHDKP